MGNYCSELSEHEHEAYNEPVGEGTNYQWTTEQTQIVMDGVRNGQNPTTIMISLKPKNPAGAVLPKKSMLHNKISYCKTLLAETEEIVNTGDLRAAIEKKRLSGKVGHFA